MWKVVLLLFYRWGYWGTQMFSNHLISHTEQIRKQDSGFNTYITRWILLVVIWPIGHIFPILPSFCSHINKNFINWSLCVRRFVVGWDLVSSSGQWVVSTAMQCIWAEHYHCKISLNSLLPPAWQTDLVKVVAT